MEPIPLSQIPPLGSERTLRLTKDEAREEALRRWRALPEEERQTFRHAQVLAAGLAEELDFRTMGNIRRVIEAWLWNDIGAVGRNAEGLQSQRR